MFIQVDDANIYATSFGAKNKPVIVGLGGWIGSWELWAEPFSILSQEWYTITYDHRGSGATIAPVESIRFETLVDDVFAVLDAYQVERCVLAAESAGALTALGAALKNPERITGLVVVDGMYFRDIPVEQDPFLLGLQKNYQATINYFVEACVPEADSNHIKRWGRQIIGRASQDAAIALYLAAGQVDLRGDLYRINQPTLILHGEADPLVTMREAKSLAESIPNSKLIIIEGAGHVPTLTRPVEVANEVMKFFGG